MFERQFPYSGVGVVGTVYPGWVLVEDGWLKLVNAQDCTIILPCPDTPDIAEGPRPPKDDGDNAGAYLEWGTTALEDAFSYAERRLGGRGPDENSSIEPKNVAGMTHPDIHPLMAHSHKKVFMGIGWRELQGGNPQQAPPPQPEPQQAPDQAQDSQGLLDPRAAPFLR